MSRAYILPPELSEITIAEWEILHKRLLVFAFRRYGKCRDNVDLQDIVSESITDLLAGVRVWPKEQTDFQTFMFGVVRSKISHHLARAQRHLPIEQIEDESESSFSDLSEVESRQYRTLYDQELLQFLNVQLTDDKILQRMVEMWGEDATLKPSEIARHLGISSHTVYNAMKRLRRRLLPLLGSENNERT